jgi:hypothetical protein
LIPFKIYSFPSLPVIPAELLPLIQGQKSTCEDGRHRLYPAGFMLSPAGEWPFSAKIAPKWALNSFNWNNLRGKLFRINELQRSIKSVSA